MAANSSSVQQTGLDRICAYTVAVESIPTARQWGRAIRWRDDGTSARGILDMLNLLRADLMARIGMLASGSTLAPGNLPGTAPRVQSTRLDSTAALEIALHHLPRGEDWATAWQQRGDAISVEGVEAGLAEIRREFYVRLGDLQAKDCPCSESQHQTARDAHA